MQNQVSLQEAILMWTQENKYKKNEEQLKYIFCTQHKYKQSKSQMLKQNQWPCEAIEIYFVNNS